LPAGTEPFAADPARRPPAGRARRRCAWAVAIACALGAVPTTAAAQGVLDQFSYEGLHLAGVGIDAGALFSGRLERAASVAVRFDLGWFAPRVRPLAALSFFRADYAADEIAELETRLRDVVTDPTGDFSIDVGAVTLTTLAFDVDLQLVALTAGPLRPYVGVGAGAHLRFVEGPAIEGTFVEDALETIVAALNAVAGFEVVLSRSLRVTLEGRGILASGLQALTARGGLMVRLPQLDAR